MNNVLIAFEDPDNKGNQSEYHTGKPCVTPGCKNPAGTAWSPYWCFECNVKRIKGLETGLNAVIDNFKKRKSDFNPKTKEN